MLTPVRALQEMSGEKAPQSLGKRLLASVLLGGAFLFSRFLQTSLRFEINYWSLFFSSLAKQVLKDVSFILTSKRLFYDCILCKETIQAFSNLGIPGNFPPPQTQISSYISMGCCFKNIDLIIYPKKLETSIQTKTCTNKYLSIHVHRSTIQNNQKLETTKRAIS